MRSRKRVKNQLLDAPENGQIGLMNEEPMPQLQADRLTEAVNPSENLIAGGVAGLVAAGVGAMIWASITYFTNYQIGFMAIGVGYLVGLAMQKVGHGHSSAFGVTAAVIAVIGCLLGNLLSTFAFISDGVDTPMAEVIGLVTPQIALELLMEDFGPIDALFYFLAIGAAYRTSRAE